MPEQGRRFSPQFKAEAVQMVVETGKPITEVILASHEGDPGELGEFGRTGLALFAEYGPGNLCPAGGRHVSGHKTFRPDAWMQSASVAKHHRCSVISGHLQLARSVRPGPTPGDGQCRL